MQRHGVVMRLCLSVLAVIMLAACAGASGKPSHYGFFLKNGSKLVEMKEFIGPPDSGETNGIPSTRDAQPVIVAWHNRLTPQWLQLFSDYAEGDLVGYDTVPKDGGALEFRPQEALEPDGYCFVQGDPLGMPYGLATWCFRVDHGAAPDRGSGGGAGWLVWVLLIVLAAAAGGFLLLYRSGAFRPGASRVRSASAPPARAAFCMHCGQPVQGSGKFCPHCGKPLQSR